MMKTKKKLSVASTLSLYKALLFIFVFAFSPSYAQLKEFPLPQQNPTSASQRTEALTLPFWDDFSSFNQTANTTLWKNAGAWVNYTMGIYPPSIGVITFDGTNADGTPYNVNNTQEVGTGDVLTSQTIDLTAVSADKRNTVYLSFYYQFQGNGEPPDEGDIFSLSFLNASNQWNTVWQVTNDGAQAKDKFVWVNIPINDAQYFHSGFQFQFKNYGRLSGPYDTWNLDYVYLNLNRSSTDSSMPDRTVTTPLSPIFGDYHAVPLLHIPKQSSLFKAPSLTLYNLRANNIQPVNYNSSVSITTYYGKTPMSTKKTLDVAKDIGALIGGQYKDFTLTTLPVASDFSSSADSILFTFSVGISTKDNVPLTLNGDYDPTQFSPINFKVNDTLFHATKLKNYYAHDDGSAEYAVGINSPGAEVAYRFSMGDVAKDTILSLDICFPNFGNSANQIFEFHVWKDNNGVPGSSLYNQTFNVTRSSPTVFTNYALTYVVPVEKVFYVGWKQLTTTAIPVGLDKSSNSASNIFVRSSNDWLASSTVKGNMMIRPRLGRGQVITAVEKQKALFYPNPSEGEFYFSTPVHILSVTDVLGKNISFEARDGALKISSASGVVFVRYQKDGEFFVEKLLVR